MNYVTISTILFSPDMRQSAAYLSRQIERLMDRIRSITIIKIYYAFLLKNTIVHSEYATNICCMSQATQSQDPPLALPYAVQYTDRPITGLVENAGRGGTAGPRDYSNSTGTS